MVLQMLTHLFFSFTHKPQAPLVAYSASDRTQTKRQGVKRRVQQAWAAVELFQPGFTPGQVINFFSRCMIHAIAHIRQARCQRLSLIQGLCAHLTRVIDAHQPSGQQTFSIG